MAGSFTEYLTNSYDPTSAMIGTWLEQQAVDRAVARAEMEKLYQQRLAAQAAQAKSNPYLDYLRAQAASGVTPGTGMAPVYGGAPAPVEAPGFWGQFFGRAVPQTQATLAEGAALLGHILGADEFRDDMLGYAQERKDVAAQTPHTVQNFSDIRSLGDFGTYLFENAVDQIPNALAMVTGAGAGALGAKVATSLAGRALGQALTKEAARTAMHRAALGGSFAASGALEGGSAYGTDVQKHGVEDASPWMDLATGAVAGSLDMLGPVSGTFVKVLGKPVTTTATRRALQNLSSEKATKTILKGLGQGAKREGVTEALQELAQIANEKAQDGDYRFTSDDMGRMLEAGFLGGVLGAPFGVGGRFIDKGRAPGQLAEINKDIQARWDARSQQRAEREAARQAALQEEFRGAMDAPRYTPFEDTVDTFYQQTPTITTSNAYSYPSRPFAKENGTVDSFLAGNPFGESAAFPTTPDTFYQNLDVRSPQEKAFDETNQAAARLRTTLRSAEDVVKQESALQKTRLAADARDIMRQLAIVESSNMNAKQKKQAAKDLNKQLAANRAQQIKVDEATKKRTDAIQKTLVTKGKQLANNYIEDAVIRRDQQGLTRNPFEFTRLIQMREQAKALYQRQTALLRERLQKVTRQIQDAERNLTRTQSQIAPEGLPGQESFSKTAKATAKMFSDQITAAKKERTEISNRLRKMTSALNRIDASIQQYSEGKGRPTFIQSDLDDLFDGGVQNTPTKADQVAMTALRDSLDAYAQQQAKQRLSESVAERTEARRTKSDVRKYNTDIDYLINLEEEWNAAADNRAAEKQMMQDLEVANRAPFPTTVDNFYNSTPEVTQGRAPFDRAPDTFLSSPELRVSGRPFDALDTQSGQIDQAFQQIDREAAARKAARDAYTKQVLDESAVRATRALPVGDRAIPGPMPDSARGELAWRNASEAQRRRSSPWPDTRPGWSQDIDENTTLIDDSAIALPAGVEQRALPESESTTFDRTPDNFYGTTPEVKGFVESNPDIKSPMISRFPEAVDAFYNYTPDIVEGTWLMTDATTKPTKAKSSKESAKLTPKDKSNLDATRAIADEDYKQAVEDVRHAAIRLESTSKNVDKKSWTKKLNDGLVKAKQALNKLLNLNIEQLRTNADTSSKKLVTQGITPSLEMLPLLSHNVTIVDSVDVPEAAGRTGYITRDQKIYLVADNIVAEAKQRKKSVKEIATRTLVHEGLAHYGLRAIMSPAELGNFLHDFRRKFENTPTWKRAAASIPEFDQLNKRQQAEEVFAKLSERYKINNLLESSNLAKGYLSSFIKKLDSKLGLTDLTLDDVKSLLTVAADRLSMESAGQGTADIGAHYRTIPQTGLARSLDPNLESMTRVERAEAEAAQRFPFSNRVQEAVANRENTIEYLREGLIDSFRPVERMIQAVKDLGKKAGNKARVTWDTNVYKLSQHLSSQQALALQQYKTNFVDPLVDLISDTALPGEDYRVTFARVSDYVEAVAAYERNDFGAKKGLDFPLVPGKKGTSLQESQDYFRSIINKYSSESMNKVMDQLQKINNERLRLLEEKKIIPKEVIDNWRAAYKYYMPFKSWENVVQELDPAWYNSNTRRSLSTPNVQKKIMKRATGREGEAQNPILHSILQLYDVSNLSRTVDIGRALLRLVRNNPDATSIFEMVEYRDKSDKDWGKPRLTTDPETGEQVYVVDHGAMKRVVNKQTGDISLVPTKHTAEGEMKNTVAVIDEDGTVQRVLLHDSGVARALRAENLARASGVVRAMGAIQHELGKYMTSRNPLFWITNPIRDTVSAAINISSLSQELEALGIPNSKEISQSILVNGLGKALTKNSVRNALMYFRKYGTFDDVTIKNKDGSTKTIKSGLSDEMKMFMSDYEQYLNYGGQTEYFGTNTYETLKKDILSALKDKNPKTFLEKRRSNINKMMEYMDEVSNSLENMTRYIAFKEIVDRLKPYAEAGRTADNRPFSYEEMYSRAANIALNLTVNFSRKGSWAPIFNSLYMFASASIGGNVRMLETIFRKDRKTGKTDWNHVARFAMYPMLGYALQAIIARALMGDDDDGVSFYDKIPEYIKASNIIIPNPISKGDYITIPITYGFDMFWNLAMNVFEAGHSAAYGNPGPNAMEAASSIIGKMFNNFATIGGTDEGWTAFVPSIIRPLWQLSQNKNFAGNPIMPTGNENLRGEIPDHEKYWSTANPSLVWLTKALSPIIDVSPESVEHIANAYLGGLGRITFGLLGRLDEWARYGLDHIDVGKVPGLKVLYKTTQDSDTSALFSKMRTNVLTQINAVDTARTDMRLTPEEKRTVLMDNLQGYRLKPTLNKLQQQLNLLREQERKLMSNPSISSDAKATRLDQINQLKQRAMKQFIKAANQAGVIG